MDPETGAIGSPTFTNSTNVTYFSGANGQAIAYETSNTKYFDLTISTLGYNNITISFAGRSSASTGTSWGVTGDSVGGTTFTSITSLSCTKTFANLNDYSLGVNYSNKNLIRIRITATGSGTATMRLDDLIIKGTSSCTAPTPTWITPPSTNDCPNINQYYETQSGMSNYVWTFPVDASSYQIISGGTATDNNLTIKYLTKGGKNISVGYSSGGCASTAPATHTQIVNGVSIGPLSAQNIVAGTNGNQLNASEDGTVVSREWKYSTSSSGPFVLFAAPQTGVSYVPNFSTAGTYYMVCESQFSCGSVTSNAITINVSALQKPVINSGNTKITTYGTAGTAYQITATNSPTSYVITSPTTLPAGFIFDSSAGTLSAAASTDAGVYNFTITASNSAGASDPFSLAWTQNKRTATISGVTVNPKVYDQSNVAELNLTSATLNNILASDAGNVGVSATGYTAIFTNVNAGTRSVTVNNLSLSGSRSGNYNLTQPTGLTGVISAKPITVSGWTANDKTYDTTTTATINYASASFSGVISPDTVGISSVTASFADANAEANKPVTISAVALSNSNYTVSVPVSGLSATISRKIPNVTPASLSLGVSTTTELNTAINTESDGAKTYAIPTTTVITLAGSQLTAVELGTSELYFSQPQTTNYEAVSVTISITVEEDPAVVGDYKTIYDGNWNVDANWQIKDAALGWINTSYPKTNTAATIYIKNKTTLNIGACNFKNVVVTKTGELTQSTNGGMTILSNGRLLVQDKGTFINTTVTKFASSTTSVLEVENGGTLINNYASNPLKDNLFLGKEVFHPNSNFVVTAVDANSFLTDLTVLTPYVDINSNSGYFGNIIFNYTTVSGMDLISGTTSVVAATSSKITNGDLIFRSGPSAFRFFNGNINVSSSSTAQPYTIGGNLIVESGFTSTLTMRNTSYTAHLKVNKNFVMNGTAVFRMTGSIITTAENLYVDGDVILNDSSTFLFSTNSNNTQPSLSLYLKGDITVGANATFTNLNSVNNNANLYFVNSGDGLTPTTTQAIDIAPTTGSNAKINFSLVWPDYPSTPYVKLVKDLVLGTNSKFNVLSGGTLDFGFAADGVTALNILANGNGQTFTSVSGSNLKITSPEGITKTANLGNVQVPVAGRTYNGGATYHYIGKENQKSGDGLPDGLTNKLIVDLQTTDALNENLEFRADGIIKFNSDGTLEIRKGKVIDEPGKGFRNNVVENEDGESDGQKGNILMTGGRYVVSGSGTKPSLSGSYTLTGGTVEFAGVAATKIRTSSSPVKQYYNVDVSGTNVQAGGKNLIVNQVTKVIGTGKLTIPAADDDKNPYVLTAKKGIQVDGTATALFENNAQLMQDVYLADDITPVVNSGNITMLRKASVPKDQYNFWAAPVSGMPIGDMYNGFQKVMKYNTETNNYTTIANSTLFDKGIGYSVKGSSNNDVHTVTNGNFEVTTAFVGTPNNGDITPMVLSIKGSRYNLIGNPYPSNINLDVLYTDNASVLDYGGSVNNTAIQPTMYFWDNLNNPYTTQQANYNGQNYAVYNALSKTGTAATNGSNMKKPNGLVKPGQGFMVRAKSNNGANSTLIFKQSGTSGLRVTANVKGGTDAPYYKGGDSIIDHVDRFWVRLTTPNNIYNTIAVVYKEKAQNTYDLFDSMLMNGAASDLFYSLSNDGVKLAIQGRKGIVSTEDVVPLGFKNLTSGLHTISIVEKQGVFESGQTVYLKDKALDKIVDITNNSYTYSANLGSDDSRFEIVYKEDVVLGVGNGLKSDFVVYRDGSDFVVKSSKTLGKVEVYDTAGRLLVVQTTSNKILKLNTSTLPEGVFIIKAENSGDIKTKKIIK
ncbi:YDG domain-containing protein [Epilithonimonas hispanica]|nr:YDG domain-containing protein [Epilithonimonas hispanica]